MAVTSPAVSSKDAHPVTPGTTTGASLLSKEKPLNATHEDAAPGSEPPLVPPATISYFRSPRTQARTLPLGPQPTTPGLSTAPREGVPPPNRPETTERPIEKQKLSRAAIPEPPAIISELAQEEDGIPASQAERETFTYWRSGRSQAKGPIEGLEKAAGSLKEEAEDLMGGKFLIEPEKITYWKPGRVADPEKFSPTALAALPALLTNQAKKVEEGVAKAVDPVNLEDLEKWPALIEPDKITYWRPGRVADPAKYAPAAIAALPSVLKAQAKGIGEGIEKAVVSAHPEDLENLPALIEPDKIT